MIYTARYYQNHINAGLTYIGRDEEGEEEWLGTDEKWNRLNYLEDKEIELQDAF